MDLITLLDEIRAMGQTGLHYAEDPFDRARCERLVELASQRLRRDLPARIRKTIRARFLADTGYVTAKVGADGAVFDADDRVLLVRRADDDRWGLVAGWVDPNESPEQTLVREFAEELGVEGRVERFVGTVLPAGERGLRTPLGDLARLPLLDHSRTASRCSRTRCSKAAWHDVDDDIEWHLNHETARATARARRGGAHRAGL